MNNHQYELTDAYIQETGFRCQERRVPVLYILRVTI